MQDTFLSVLKDMRSCIHVQITSKTDESEDPTTVPFKRPGPKRTGLQTID